MMSVSGQKIDRQRYQAAKARPDPVSEAQLVIVPGVAA
jgi:hypothetical protein